MDPPQAVDDAHSNADYAQEPPAVSAEVEGEREDAGHPVHLVADDADAPGEDIDNQQHRAREASTPTLAPVPFAVRFEPRGGDDGVVEVHPASCMCCEFEGLEAAFEEEVRIFNCAARIETYMCASHCMVMHSHYHTDRHEGIHFCSHQCPMISSTICQCTCN